MKTYTFRLMRGEEVVVDIQLIPKNEEGEKEIEEGFLEAVEDADSVFETTEDIDVKVVRY
jgi:hypothetical protein